MKKYFYLTILAMCSFAIQIQASPGAELEGRACPAATELEATDIPLETLHAILTQAAPQFGFLPDQFIRLYEDCSCITVLQIGPNVYRVEYGGLGIEILVDVSATIEIEPVVERFRPRFLQRF